MHSCFSFRLLTEPCKHCSTQKANISILCRTNRDEQCFLSWEPDINRNTNTDYQRVRSDFGHAQTLDRAAVVLNYKAIHEEAPSVPSLVITQVMARRNITEMNMLAGGPDGTRLWKKSPPITSEIFTSCRSVYMCCSHRNRQWNERRPSTEVRLLCYVEIIVLRLILNKLNVRGKRSKESV